MTRSLVIVGGGPRTVGLVERLAANTKDLPHGAGLAIHVVEPFALGAGRVWRPDQSPLLWMNSRAEEVAMFTDHTVDCAGPIRPGPTLYEWSLQAEDVRLTPGEFPSRTVAARYLEWCMAEAIRVLPANVDFRWHKAKAVSVVDDGPVQEVLLSTGDRVRADFVVMAQGNIDGSPDQTQQEYARFADDHACVYVPPGYTADLDLSVLPPGQDVIVSGLGLAFVDLVVLLTEGRGGAFHRRADGTLRYAPSGREPVLWAGSRRGVPFLPKPGTRLSGPAPGLPRFVTPECVASGDLWDAMRKELGWGYYHELFTAHPGRTAMRWNAFAGEYSRLAWDSPEMANLVAHAVPTVDDRLRLTGFTAPLGTRRFAGEPEFGQWMRSRLRRLASRATDPRHSADAGAFRALLSIGDQLTAAMSGPVDPAIAKSVAKFSRLSGFMASGPPPYRIEQLAALSASGIVRFIGAKLAVRPDHARGTFVATTETVGECVRAKHFVAAMLPDPDIARGTDPLLGSLARSGDAALSGGRLVVDPATFQVRNAGGENHPQRMALGAFATAGRLGAFSRPCSNAPFFRQNDDVARRILAELSLASPS